MKTVPMAADSYGDQQIPSLFEKLIRRVQREPLNLVATIIFFAAIIHTVLTAQFRKIGHRYQQRCEAIENLLHTTDGPADPGKEHDKLIFRAQFFQFMGEVEAVFGVWLVPLFLAIVGFHGWSTMVDYVGNVNVADAIFVVVIMAIASSLPILRFAESVIAKVSVVGQGTPASSWLAILTLGPLLGSFITGPAAMTICALLLRYRFYSLKPSASLKYATLGLLFVNISVGGVLTQFASPSVVIVARIWHWDLLYMLTHFGWKAVIGIILSNLVYLAAFRIEFARLAANAPEEEQHPEGRRPIPWQITGINILFLSIQPRQGKFREAEGGTLFLDEIGDMPLEMQAKILRVLQDKVVARLAAIGQRFGYHWIFYLVCLFALGSAAAVALIRPQEINHTVARGGDDKDPGTGTSQAGGVIPIPDLLRKRDLMVFLVSVVLFHSGNAAMLPMAGQVLQRRIRTPTLFL